MAIPKIDFIVCEYPLPDMRGSQSCWVWATVNMPTRCGDRYKVDASGKLWHEEYDVRPARGDTRSDGVIERSQGIGWPLRERFNARWVLSGLSGFIRFRAYGESDLHEACWANPVFEAYFELGHIKRIRRVDAGAPGPVESSSACLACGCDWACLTASGYCQDCEMVGKADEHRLMLQDWREADQPASVPPATLAAPVSDRPCTVRVKEDTEEAWPTCCGVCGKSINDVGGLSRPLDKSAPWACSKCRPQQQCGVSSAFGEPWHVWDMDPSEIQDARGRSLLRLDDVYDDDDPDSVAVATRDRIVVCVNACEGMGDPASVIAHLRSPRRKLAMEKPADAGAVWHGPHAGIPVRENCILDADSPSFPPTKEEHRQCGCAFCRLSLLREGVNSAAAAVRMLLDEQTGAVELLSLSVKTLPSRARLGGAIGALQRAVQPLLLLGQLLSGTPPTPDSKNPSNTTAS